MAPQIQNIGKCARILRAHPDRVLRLYVPKDDERIMATDEIIPRGRMAARAVCG